MDGAWITNREADGFGGQGGVRVIEGQRHLAGLAQAECASHPPVRRLVARRRHDLSDVLANSTVLAVLAPCRGDGQLERSAVWCGDRGRGW